MNAPCHGCPNRRGWLYYDRVAKKHSPNLKRVADVLRVGVEELRGRKASEVEG